jgi:hypothetical protein
MEAAREVYARHLNKDVAFPEDPSRARMVESAYAIYQGARAPIPEKKYVPPANSSNLETLIGQKLNQAGKAARETISADLT